MILRYQANTFPKNAVTTLNNFWVLMTSEYNVHNPMVGASTDKETFYVTKSEGFVNKNKGFLMT